MRRVIAIVSVLLCLVLQTAAASPAATEAPTADAAPAQTGTVAAGAFPMGVEPSRPVEADAVLLLDLESGQTLYERGADLRVYPASTTKIMTALCVADAVEDLDGTEVTVRQEVLDLLPHDTISMAGLADGEKLSVRELLYCLLLPSGNDAAVVLGDYVGGSLDGFVAAMNEKARELGCTDTNFVSVNGLSGEEHYSTARDMARMAQALLEDRDLARIVRTPFYTLKTNLHDKLELENTNHMLDPEHEYYLPEVTGVKTGSSELSGRCVVASVEKDGMRLLGVIMGAQYRDGNGTIIEPSPAIVEAYKLFRWALSAYSRVELCGESDALTVELDGIGPAEARPAWTMTAVLPADRSGSVTQTVTTDEGLQAPLRKGDTVGEIQYSCGDTVLGTAPLVLDRGISAAVPWWIWLLSVAAALAALALVLAVRRRRGRLGKAASAQTRERTYTEDEDDFSPFVEYAPHERARKAGKK